MSPNAPVALQDAATDDSIDPVNALEFAPETGRRAVYEAFSFDRAGDIVRVTNESHGDVDDDPHTYTVELDARDVPTRCTCPAYEYHCTGSEVCKHAVAVALHLPEIADQAVATDGGEIIVADDDGEILDDGDDDQEDVVDLSEVTGEGPPADDADDTPDDCDCADLGGEFPCWECYRTGRAALSTGGDD